MRMAVSAHNSSLAICFGKSPANAYVSERLLTRSTQILVILNIANANKLSSCYVFNVPPMSCICRVVLRFTTSISHVHQHHTNSFVTIIHHMIRRGIQVFVVLDAFDEKVLLTFNSFELPKTISRHEV